MKKILTSIALVALTCTASTYAQTANNNAPVPGAPSAAKKDLLQRLMALQQTALENMARNLAEQPARQMMAAAEQAMNNVPQDKREAAAKQIQAEAKKYADEANTVVKERTSKLAQTVLTPMFDEKFTEDELRQLLVSLEAPAYKKYQAALPDLSSSFAEKLIEDLRPVLDPKLKALEDSVSKALGGGQIGASAPKKGKGKK